MKYAYTTSDGVRMGYAESMAGWGYGQSGCCYQRTTNVRYPWHEPHHGKCLRCGEVEPQRMVFAPMPVHGGVQ